ncbi:MAG TPA: sigma 54-interacting transcriptional regulator [Candidatus Wallbacteria bacterium]|nr:sigma 54-interacting transcriptional regulator [Candidatus Wallbacteria bacterium]
MSLAKKLLSIISSIYSKSSNAFKESLQPEILEAICLCIGYEHGVSIVFKENEYAECFSGYNSPEEYSNTIKKSAPSLTRFIKKENLQGNKVLFFDAKNLSEENAFLFDIFSKLNKKYLTLTIISDSENIKGAILLFKNSREPAFNDELDALECLSAMLHAMSFAERTKELSTAYDKIEKSLFIEKLTSDMLYRVLNISPDNLEKELNVILKEIAIYFKQDKCSVIIYSEKSNKVEELYRWPYGDDNDKAELNDLIEKHFSQLYPIHKRLLENEIINISDVEKKDDAVDPFFWRSLKIKSVILFPLFINKKYKGWLALSSNTTTKKWSEEEISSLKLFAHILDGIITNIKNQKELAEAQKIFSLFMEHIPEAVYIKDENSRYSFVNKAFEKLVSAKTEDILAKSSFDFFDHEMAEKFSEQDKKIINSEDSEGKTLETEVDLTSKNGNKYIVRKFKLFGSGSSSILGGIAFDVTERKNLQNELIKNERKYRHLVELANEGYLKTDKDGIIAFVNKRLCEITGYSKNELMGVSIFQYTNKQNSETWKNAFERCKNGFQSDFTIAIKSKNNQTVHLKVTASPIFEENGPFTGILSLITDFTKEIELEKEINLTRQKLLDEYSYFEIYYKSESMKKIIETLQVVANSDCNLLIEGPSGTGKTHIARVIHGISGRRKKPFITVNCGSLPENLLESELFGYLKGAFTGADKDKPGKFSAASGGLIFLDEIGELPLNLQVKLLRVIEEKCYEPIGSNKTVKVDVKIIAATNKNLYSLIKEGKFRNDLYYRLKIVSFAIPALKERPEDIAALIENFINFFNNKYSKNIIRVSDETFRFLMAYDFPGNIRELKNMLERAFIFCNGNVIEMQHFAGEYSALYKKIATGDLTSPVSCLKIKGFSENETNVAKPDEKERLVNALENCAGNRSRAAKVLKISTVTLWRKIKKYGLNRVSKKPLHKEERPEAAAALKKTLSKAEKKEKNAIIEALHKTYNNKTKTAVILNLDRVTLWRKMKKYGLN